jgi:hypothetical protein
MTAKDLLLDQTASSHRWIEKMIDHVPAERWGLIPAGLNTSLKWQVGHLVLEPALPPRWWSLPVRKRTCWRKYP